MQPDITVKSLSWVDIGDGYWYLATPYSKYPEGIEAAFRDACKVSARLIEAGVRVFSPIAHSHPIAVHGNLNPLDHDMWLPVDAPMMRGAYGLLVAKLPTWESSYGISVEIDAFRQANKPVTFLETEGLL